MPFVLSGQLEASRSLGMLKVFKDAILCSSKSMIECQHISILSTSQVVLRYSYFWLERRTVVLVEQRTTRPYLHSNLVSSIVRHF